MFEADIRDDYRHFGNELKNAILLILTLIDLIFIFLSIFTTFGTKIENIFADYDFIVCLLLFIDLMYEFYCSDRSLKEFFINDKNIISLISIFPFDILFRYFAVFRILRFLRVIKIVRVWNVIKDRDSLYYFIHYHSFGVLFLLLLIYVSLSSIFLILVDDSVNNLSDAFYFIVITATTVGFGDIVPVSAIGKALTIITIIVGIVFVAILTAHLTMIYNQQDSLQIRKTLRDAFTRTNRVVTRNNKEIKELHKKIDNLEKENKLLHEKIDNMNENIEKLIEK